jgi:HEAT repeat protein
MRSEYRDPKSERNPKSEIRKGSRVMIGKLILMAGMTVMAFSSAAADLDQAIAEAAKYESGVSAEPLRLIEKAVRESAGNPAQRAETEAALVKLLAPASTFEARRFACTQLAIIGTDASLPAIAELLKQPETAGIGCLALGSNPSPKVNEVLRQALTGAEGMVRIQLINTLGDRRDSQAVKALAPMAEDKDLATASAALGALGKIAAPDAVAILTKSVSQGQAGNAPERLQAACLASLVAADLICRQGKAAEAIAIYDRLLAKEFALNLRRAALEGALRADKDGGEKRALSILRGEDAALKQSAIVHVRRIKSPGASAVFARELPRLSPDERVLLIGSLAVRNDAAARTAITAQLQAPEEIVRQAAVVAFARIGNAGDVPELAKAMRAAQASEQSTLELAMASLQGGAGVDQAILSLVKTGKDLNRAGLINVLARRSCATAVPVLLPVLKDADANAAKAAARALGKLAGPNDLPALLAQLEVIKVAAVRSEFEASLARVIERVTDVDGRSRLVAAALAKPVNADTRGVLIALLPTCGGTPALAAAKAALAEPTPAIREAALRALADWPDASAVDTLLDVAKASTQNTERVLALRGCVRMLGNPGNYSGHELALRFEKVMALARNAGEKKLVLGKLPVIADPLVLNLIQGCLGEAEVQAEAAQAAVRLAPALCGAYREETKAVLQKVVDLPAAGDSRQTASSLLETMGKFNDFILAWNVCGPFEQAGKNGQALFDVAFPPEQPGAAGLKWQIVPAGTLTARPWQLDLGKLFGGDNRVAYALTFVYSENDQEAQLELGCDDGVKAWVNDKVVITANRGGDVAPGSEKAKVTLNKGWNRVLLKVTQWSAGWGYCARLAKPDGTPLSGIRISLQAAQP